MKKKIKAIIFDLNGVFIISSQLSKRLEEKFGISADVIWPVLKDILKKTRLPETRTEQVWDPLLALLNTTQKDLFSFWFSGETLNHDLLKYTQELISTGYLVIILSNNFPERTTYYRNTFPEIFSTITKAYFSWETGLIKPDPKVYSTLLRENNLSPEECVYFDDSQDNITAAQNIGIHSYIFSGLDETKKVIDALG